MAQNHPETNGLLKYDPPVAVDETKKTHASAVTGVDGEQLNRDVLNSIFPPIEFDEDGVHYQQCVSASPTSKADVIQLKNNLELLLLNQKARMIGVCQTRSLLYSQAFDEVIRQVTIESNARGRLLTRIRDHYKQLVQSYKDLNDNALLFGSNKNMQVTLGMDDLLKQNKELKSRRRDLELEANDLQLKLDATEKRIQENKQLREKEYADEIAFLKRQGQQMKQHYDLCQNKPP